MTNQKHTSRNPWAWIPTLYFAEGIPYILINTVSVICYKKMGIDNAQIAFWTSWLYLPWVIKMFWGPLVDNLSTKRNWIIYTQLFMSGCLGFIAFTLHLPVYFAVSLLAFTIGAFVSATHDIAADGLYLLSLNKEDQAFFVGIRSVFYRIAMIFGSGFLVYLAGQFEVSLNNIPLSWTIVFSISACIFLLIFIYHRFILPYPESDKPRVSKERTPYVKIFAQYFSQKRIWAILLFILFYRFGEAMLVKLASPFLLDKHEAGGLGFSTSEVGIVYGTVGVICLILGGIVGGWVISKYGLKKCIWFFAITLNVPHFAYLYMAYAQPPIELAFPLVAIEQFGYGFGFTAFMVYLMYISKGEYKTTFFAISTGIMALGMMIPGLISGYIQQAVGYQMFFTIVLLMAIPGLGTLFFIPFEEDENKETN
jgi:PAT family beta-lactamase induction signal transducer AmpG